jgi:hypothetical protein
MATITAHRLERRITLGLVAARTDVAANAAPSSIRGHAASV